MTDLSYSALPVAGTPNNASDVLTPLNEIKAYVNGADWVDNARLSATAVSDSMEATGDNAKAGLSTSSTIRRGKSIIATEESRSSATPGTLTTPDQVSNLVLPTDGLIFVAFRAQWKSSFSTSAAATLYLGSNAVKTSAGGASGTNVTALVGSNNAYYRTLALHGGGLVVEADSAFDSGAEVTTGQAVAATPNDGIYRGGPMAIYAAAGTYDVSVKFSAPSGSVTAKNRKLWVWTMGF